MNGPIAQIVALTCHGNAVLRGIKTPQFFPNNSTCKFCDAVRFIEYKKTASDVEEGSVLDNPDAWFSWLENRGVVCLKLFQFSQNDPRLSDRMSAGFVGGGKSWVIEAQLKSGISEFWSAQWDVWNQDAPESRIWMVLYAMFDTVKTQHQATRSVNEIKTDFRKALIDIHDFSEKQDCGGFTVCFANALKALDHPDSDVGYHKDLFPCGTLAPDAESLLKAAMSAWVFGGMGSWNDMGFLDNLQNEYERVSNALFEMINEAIAVGASSSASTQTNLKTL